VTIYLDHNATTPVDPAVLDAMLPLLRDQFANPSSTHQAGRAVSDLVDVARDEVAALVGAPRGPQGYDVVFTSGATEGANLAILGTLAGMSLTPGRSVLVVGSTEHKAVLEPARQVTGTGRAVLAPVAVRRDGTLDVGHLRQLLDGDVALVAVMAANNETGALTNLRQVARLAHEAGALVFSDLTQAAGKVPLELADWDVDLAVLSAHKICGPKGVGALVARRELIAKIRPQTLGGGQEHGLRAGTLNTPGIVGFGVAAVLAAERLPAESRRLARLTRLLHSLFTDRLDAVLLNGPVRGRLPNTVNLRFAGAPADAVLTCVPEVAMSSGAACYGGTNESSHVLEAMGQDRVTAAEGIRFSLGRTTTEAEVRRAAALVAEGVEHVRGLRGALARWRGSGTQTASGSSSSWG
jgi:cysteine desulfurase